MQVLKQLSFKKKGSDLHCEWNKGNTPTVFKNEFLKNNGGLLC